MKKIKQEIVLNSIINLKGKTFNKIWGLLTLFASTEGVNFIDSNTTYKVDSKKISEKLQDLFYFGNSPKKFESYSKLYFRLSNKWEYSVLDYVTSEKAEILDAAIFYFKNKLYSKEPTDIELIQDFIIETKLSKKIVSNLFKISKGNKTINLESFKSSNNLFEEFKKIEGITSNFETFSFESPFAIKSHPSEFKRAPFIQTLYSGSKIQETILLTDFNLDDYYPKSNVDFIQTKIYSTNKIYFGAPGTGKSHKVKTLLEGKEARTQRVTFHPDYDYSSFVGGYKPTSDETGEKIRYEFVPQAFTNIYVEAWQNQEQDFYLVIEEINRGNCAEIFGDIFQLLDRTSDYPITPSKELGEYLVSNLGENANGIKDGTMILPPNLNIYATMNTSDQSLFPMDSAFKRRWEWEYIPINYEEVDSEGKLNTSYNFEVLLDESDAFGWLEFIEAVNARIKGNPNLGMDKCIGNYFLIGKDNQIPLDQFINKAIFYLWNDVFKDEEDGSIFSENSSYEDFFPINTKGKQKVKEMATLLELEFFAPETPTE